MRGNQEKQVQSELGAATRSGWAKLVPELHANNLAKVAGKEQVTTPAGTFDTFRVEAKLRQVDSKDQTKSFLVTQWFWYAPDVNRWVKKKLEARFEGRLRDSYSEELTEYSRKP